MNVSAQSANLTHFLESKVPEKAKGWLFIALLAGLGMALLIGAARPVTPQSLDSAVEAPQLLLD